MSTPLDPRRGPVLASLLIMVLAGAGCAALPTPGTDPATPPATDPATPPAAQADAGADASQPAGPTTPGSSVAATALVPDAPEVARKQARVGGSTFTFVLRQPQRHDGLVDVAFDLHVDQFVGDDGESEGVVDPAVLSHDSQFARIPDGIALVDPSGDRRWLPAVVGTGVAAEPLCSPRLAIAQVTAGDVLHFTCSFAGVPQSLTRSTVQTTNFGSFPHVAVR